MLPYMNELTLTAEAVVDLTAVLLAYRCGREWLYGSIIVNLLLISILGVKLYTIFGFVTNVGNVFYACVFFAIYLLMEHGSHEEGIRAIWIGVGGVLLFQILTQMTLSLTGPDASSHISTLMATLFRMTPRITIASLSAYIIAQYFNVYLYRAWRESYHSTHWWLRLAIVMILAQLIDSFFFFTIAFIGTVAEQVVIQSIFIGFAIKVVVGLVSIPLIYMTHRMKPAVAKK